MKVSNITRNMWDVTTTVYHAFFPIIILILVLRSATGRQLSWTTRRLPFNMEGNVGLMTAGKMTFKNTESPISARMGKGGNGSIVSTESSVSNIYGKFYRETIPLTNIEHQNRMIERS